MWVFYVISRKRAEQLAAQIDPRMPTERVQKRKFSAAAELEAKAKMNQLLRLIADAAGQAKGKGEVSRSTEEKFRISDQAKYAEVCRRLLDGVEHSKVGPASTDADTKNLRPLIRFHGRFRANILGKNVAESLANLIEAQSLVWTGTCGAVPLRFVTTKESIVSNTPIAQSFASSESSVEMDGFGTFSGKGKDGTIDVLPLFVGLEIN